ncbi:major facilitator superfamily domain-containing protein [Pyrenochaeta sp. MPI-SDFR-AT-0127]|nr:major facilitator superfamily domain-containing protein [Pyrenochaeta sp. MPI-SDFR-AT-0127]
MTANSISEKMGESECKEIVPESGHITPQQIQARFETLRSLNEEEMVALNKRLLKKIDWRLMPCITLMFLMNYLDRINVSNARLAGLQEDLNMTDTMWNTGISTFYVGYLVGQLPGNLWLAKADPRWLLPSMMMAWSIATICMPAMTSGAGFAVCRFFIGLSEAPFFPGITLSKSSTRYLRKYNTNMDNILGLHAWQWFFIIEGAASIAVAAVAYFVLPSWPHNTRFVSQEESEMAQYRVQVSNGGREEEFGGTWDGLKEAAKDPFTWLFCLMHFSLVTAQSFKDFLPSIMKTFKFDTLTTYLVQAPPYAIAYAVACGMAYTSGRFQESCYHIVIPIFFSAIGCSMLISTLNVGARYFGLILLISGTYSGLNLQLSWETTLVPAPRSKKAALIAIANCISQVSHWFSPYFFPTSQEPFYRLGGGLILFGCAACAASAALIKWRAMKLNKKLDEAQGWSEHSGNERGWRYVY